MWKHKRCRHPLGANEIFPSNKDKLNYITLQNAEGRYVNGRWRNSWEGFLQAWMCLRTTEAAQQVCRDVCWKLFAIVPTGKEQSGWRDRLRIGARAEEFSSPPPSEGNRHSSRLSVRLSVVCCSSCICATCKLHHFAARVNRQEEGQHSYSGL